MQTKLTTENCSAKLVIPTLAAGPVHAKIIVDATKSDWDRDLYIRPRYDSVVLGTYIVNERGKLVHAKGCVAYQGVVRGQPVIIVKTLGVGHFRHLVVIRCRIDGNLV